MKRLDLLKLLGIAPALPALTQLTSQPPVPQPPKNLPPAQRAPRTYVACATATGWIG
jgi:hypothetical protein